MQANITIQTEDLVTGVTSTPVTAIIGFDTNYLKGDKGDKGNSAYEDAVEQGYTGTLEQWLASLHGDDGFSPSASVTKVGDTATISITDENGTTSSIIKDGKDGDDGISPQVSISKVNGVATITITDKDGVHSATINDGTDGNDAVSPTATVSKSGSTATISITDANGTTSAQVTDGQDGVSPSATVTKSGNVTTLSVTDANGTTSQQINDGTDGVSPSVSISKANGVTTITITDVNGQHTATINDGENPQEIFWAEYGVTTYAEITAAKEAGKEVLCWYNNKLYQYTLISTSSAYHFACAHSTATYYLSITTASVWAKGEATICQGSRKDYSDEQQIINTTVYNALSTEYRIGDAIKAMGYELNGAISLTEGAYIQLDRDNGILTSNVSYKYAQIACQPYDMFLITAVGGSSPRAFGFRDSTGHILMRATPTSNLSNIVVIAPPNSAELIINTIGSGVSYKLKSLKSYVDTSFEKKRQWIKVADATLTESMTRYKVNLENYFDKIYAVIDCPQQTESSTSAVSCSMRVFTSLTDSSTSTSKYLPIGGLIKNNATTKVIAEFEHNGLTWEGSSSLFHSFTDYASPVSSTIRPMCNNAIGNAIAFSVEANQANTNPLPAGLQIQVWVKYVV